MPRLGLLCATLALPVGAVLANHFLDQNPIPAAPGEVRIGGSGDRQGGGVGRPSAPPSVAVPPVVVGQQSPATQPPAVPAGEPTSPRSTSEGVVPPAPPVVDDGNGAAKGKAKGRNSAVPSHPTPPTSRGALPGANGSGG